MPKQKIYITLSILIICLLLTPCIAYGYNNNFDTYKYQIKDDPFIPIFILSLMIMGGFLVKGVYYFSKNKDQPTDRNIIADSLAENFTAIKKVDSGINEILFKENVQSAFYRIHDGWIQNNIDIIRPYVTNKILQDYIRQIDKVKMKGEKNFVENMSIVRIDITGVRSDTTFNYITVRIEVNSSDYTSNHKGETVSGHKTLTATVEYWTFLRSINAITDLDKQLKDNKCPNCGGELKVNMACKCEYCNKVVNSGQFDWVLCEIR